jgi:hypothetical protein
LLSERIAISYFKVVENVDINNNNNNNIYLTAVGLSPGGSGNMHLSPWMKYVIF